MTDETRERIVLLIARICMASLFIFSGLEKALDYDGAVGFAQAFAVPFARYLLWIAILIELVGAAALISPRWCRIGAAVLAAWVLGLNLWFHHSGRCPPITGRKRSTASSTIG